MKLLLELPRMIIEGLILASPIILFGAGLMLLTFRPWEREEDSKQSSASTSIDFS